MYYESCKKNYKNKAEEIFKSIMSKNGVVAIRRGYPDFMIIKNDEILGFVEVKPKEENLRVGQKRFQRFCERHKIPFIKWIPGDSLPEWILKTSKNWKL